MSLPRDVVVRLLLRERAKILAYIQAILRDPAGAEDVFQDVSVLAVDRCQEIKDEGHLLAWVRQAARSKALQARRRQRAQPLGLDDDVLDLLEGDWRRHDDTPARELVESLRVCLERLTPNARRLVEMKYGEGLDGGAIAARLSREVRSIYTAMSRIHRALSDCLAGRAGQEATDG